MHLVFIISWGPAIYLKMLLKSICSLIGTTGVDVLGLQRHKLNTDPRNWSITSSGGRLPSCRLDQCLWLWDHPVNSGTKLTSSDRLPPYKYGSSYAVPTRLNLLGPSDFWECAPLSLGIGSPESLRHCNAIGLWPIGKCFSCSMRLVTVAAYWGFHRWLCYVLGLASRNGGRSHPRH